MLPVFIASGLTAQEFARRNQLTKSQARRLSAMAAEGRQKLANERDALSMEATAQTLTTARRATESMLEHGLRVTKYIEAMNAKIGPEGDLSKLDEADLNRLRYAWSVVSRLSSMQAKMAKHTPDDLPEAPERDVSAPVPVITDGGLSV